MYVGIEVGGANLFLGKLDLLLHAVPETVDEVFMDSL